MLARSVESGSALSTALSEVALKNREPIAREFRVMAGHLTLGVPMERVTHRIVRRYSTFECRMFGSTLRLHQKIGGNLAHMLRRLATVLEEREQYRRQLASATVAARISAAIVASAGPLLLLFYWIEGDYIAATLKNPAAQFYLGLALGFELVGLIWIFFLVRKEI